MVLNTGIWQDSRNLQRVLGDVRKEAMNPLFVEDRPWEVRFDNLYPNVLFDPQYQLYRCWYNPFIIDEATAGTPLDQRDVVPYRPGHEREMGVCYGTSTDGIRWAKPDLGLIEFDGSTRNNLVMRHVHGVGVTLDPHDPDPRGRYKAFMQGGVATSPDGLHWSEMHPCPEIESRWDTHNNLFWDDRHDRYVGITRLWDGRERIVGRTESGDFRHWTKAEAIMQSLPEEAERQTYAMIVFPYADMYLGLVMMFNTDDDTVDCELAWSPDTLKWDRICPGAPVIPRGPEGRFDKGCIYAAAYPFEQDGELRLYYGGSDGPHTNWRATGLGLAYLRPDGFAGVQPCDRTRTGTLVTQPLECTGPQLRISADAAGGAVRVAVLDTDDMKLENCTPVQANVTDGLVTWGDSDTLASLVGRRIRLQFELRSAVLYAFDCSSGP